MSPTFIASVIFAPFALSSRLLRFLHFCTVSIGWYSVKCSAQRYCNAAIPDDDVVSSIGVTDGGPRCRQQLHEALPVVQRGLPTTCLLVGPMRDAVSALIHRNLLLCEEIIGDENCHGKMWRWAVKWCSARSWKFVSVQS